LSRRGKREAHHYERWRPKGSLIEVRGAPLAGGGSRARATRSRGSAAKNAKDAQQADDGKWLKRA